MTFVKKLLKAMKNNLAMDPKASWSSRNQPHSRQRTRPVPDFSSHRPPKPGLDKAASFPGVILLKDTAKKSSKRGKEEVPKDKMDPPDFESAYYSSKAIAARLQPKGEFR